MIPTKIAPAIVKVYCLRSTRRATHLARQANQQHRESSARVPKSTIIMATVMTSALGSEAVAREVESMPATGVVLHRWHGCNQLPAFLRQI